MDKRTVDFIRCLRAAGIRISLAETQDALRAMDELGVMDRDSFREGLRTTLVKEHHQEDLCDKHCNLWLATVMLCAN
jgi:uncharacterized protein